MLSGRRRNCRIQIRPSGEQGLHRLRVGLHLHPKEHRRLKEQRAARMSCHRDCLHPDSAGWEAACSDGWVQAAAAVAECTAVVAAACNWVAVVAVAVCSAAEVAACTGGSAPAVAAPVGAEACTYGQGQVDSG